jgi:DNA repair photolyase
LTGIARLAAASSPAGEGHGLKVHSLGVRSILNRSVSRRGLSFTWTVNPYRGCEFVCRYRDARYTHELMELPPEEFGRRILYQTKRGVAAGARN